MWAYYKILLLNNKIIWLYKKIIRKVPLLTKHSKQETKIIILSVLKQLIGSGKAGYRGALR